jgi:hypothetical protein
MKRTSTANIALALVVAGWVLAYYGAMSQLGDPAPTISIAQIETSRHISIAILLLGITSILASLWLSGYSYPAAKARASICIALVLPPTIFVAWSAL